MAYKFDFTSAIYDVPYANSLRHARKRNKSRTIKQAETFTITLRDSRKHM